MKSLVTVDVEGTLATDQATRADPYASVDTLAATLEPIDQPVTLFVTPDVVEHRPDTVDRWIDSEATIGLHIHPAQLTGGDSDWLTDYHRDTIEEFVAAGAAVFEDVLGVTPTTFRAGRWEYSERLLLALSAQGFTVDASLRPARQQAPFVIEGVRECPMTVYSNWIIRALLRNREIYSIPLHADALLGSLPRAVACTGVTWRLVRSTAPYVMTSFHDYDLLDPVLRARTTRYLSALADRCVPVTITDI